MCSVRALTEGRGREWAPNHPDQVTGVVLRKGTQPMSFRSSPVPYVELWLGGRKRVRVGGRAETLIQAIEAAEIEVGDTVTVRYLGMAGRFRREHRVYEVAVSRGH